MDSVGNVWEGGLFRDLDHYQVVFLKKTPTGYAFDQTPALPASETSCDPNWSGDVSRDAYQVVLERIVGVLCTTTDLEEKRRALMTVNPEEEDVSAAPSLRAAMNLSDVRADPVLRTEIIADLLRSKDTSVLPLAEDELFLTQAEGSLKPNLLFAISSLDPRISVPLLTRALTLPEPEARVSAARFLEYTKSPATVDALLSALDDPDPEVQFAVMQSLGNLTNQYSWRPGTTETNSFWFDCLEHWHEFRERHRRTLSPPSTTEQRRPS
jgi:hypothetical protein